MKETLASPNAGLVLNTGNSTIFSFVESALDLSSKLPTVLGFFYETELQYLEPYISRKVTSCMRVGLAFLRMWYRSEQSWTATLSLPQCYLSFMSFKGSLSAICCPPLPIKARCNISIFFVSSNVVVNLVLVLTQFFVLNMASILFFVRCPKP